MVIDPHTHAWGPARPDHPWTNPALSDRIGEFTVHTVFDADRLLSAMDRAAIEEAVLVGYPICDWTDNWYTRAAAATHDRLYGIVMVDPLADGAGDHLRECMAVDGVIGVRLGAACPHDRMWETFDESATWLRSALEADDFWAAAQETDATIQILCDYRQFDQALAVVERYPELTYLFDHVAHADPDTPLEEGDFSTIADLAAYETVAVKVSALPHLSEEPFPYADMHGHVRWLLETFGRKRVVWGSDFPNVSDVATYPESLNWIYHVEALSAADRRWLTEDAFATHVLARSGE